MRRQRHNMLRLGLLPLGGGVVVPPLRALCLHALNVLLFLAH